MTGLPNAGLNCGISLMVQLLYLRTNTYSISLQNIAVFCFV